MLSDRRVETARSCVSIAGVFLSGRNTLIVMDVIAGEEREDPLGKDVTLVFLQIVLVVFSSFPSLLNARTLCFVHSVLVACLALSVTPFVGDYDPKMMLHRVACTFGAFFAGFVCLDFQVFIFTNTLFTATAIVSAMSTWNPSLGVPMHDVVDVELLTFVLRVGMLWKAGALLEESVRREITAKSDACQSAGMSGLLSLMCDAVVDLNEDFVMKEHVEKLAGMLMHRGGQCTEDRNCMSFIEGGDDLQRFEEGIKQFRGESPPDEALVPGMIHAGMRDALGNRIPTIFYHVPYRTLAGRVHHLLGLREDVDAERGVETPDVGPRMPPEGELRPELRSRLDRVPELRASASNSSSTRGRELGTVDVRSTHGLPILAGCAALAERCGLSEAPDNFVDFLESPAEGSRLTAWILETAETIVAGSSEPRIRSFGSVGAAAGISGAMTLQVCFPPPSADPFGYAVAIRVHRSRPRPSPAIGRGTAASASFHALAARGTEVPAADQRHSTLLHL